MVEKREVLEKLFLGKSVAEQEMATLKLYFVETFQWKQVFNGNIDLIFGPKGSGKSAIYSLISAHEKDLALRNIWVISAENPSGAPAFKQALEKPPKDENEFLFVWKLYFLTLIARKLKENRIRDDDTEVLFSYLESLKLLERSFSLSKLIRRVIDYVHSLKSIEAAEGTIHVDPYSGLPSGITGRIRFREPSVRQAVQGDIAIDELFTKANEALKKNNREVWILIDRLDVVFAQERDIERPALRSLFLAYKDIYHLQNIKLKIFIRDDIWLSISDGGFRESSHLNEKTQLAWDKKSLVNLIVKRFCQEPSFLSYVEYTKAKIESDFGVQLRIFNMLFPGNMWVFDHYSESGIDWVLKNTKDGKGITTPREVIELIKNARDLELRRLELGEPAYRGKFLFNQEILIKAMRQLSSYKLEQTLMLEFPELKIYIQALYRRKLPLFNMDQLSKIWETDMQKTKKLANRLVDIGIFDVKVHNQEYVIPYLYRYSLSIGSGKASGPLRTAIEPPKGIERLAPTEPNPRLQTDDQMDDPTNFLAELPMMKSRPKRK